MKTADFLGESSYRVHLERSRTPQRVLISCVYSFLCLIALFAFDLEVRGQERAAEQANAPDPAASEASADMERLFEDINDFATRLDPLAEHLAQPTAARMLAGLDSAVDPTVEIERVQWRTEIKVGANRKDVQSLLVLIIDAVAYEEAAATALVDVLEAYSGYTGVVEKHDSVPDRWPATRLRIRLSRDAVEAMEEATRALAAVATEPVSAGGA